MWAEIKRAPNLMIAEMWKDLFDGEGIVGHILPDPGYEGAGELRPYRVYVPREKLHVAQEVLRKI